jgi:hypothetical protein
MMLSKISGKTINKEVPYGFMIHVLDEEKTVLNVSQTNNLSKQESFERIEKINREWSFDRS